MEIYKSPGDVPIRISGAKLKAARKAAGMSQSELSQKAMLTQGILSNMESSNPVINLTILDDLCLTLKVAYGDLEYTGERLHLKGEISERFRFAYEKLKESGKITTDASFCQLTGETKSGISNMLSGRGNASLKAIDGLIKLGANFEYIYKDKLPVLLSSSAVDKKELASKIDTLLIEISDKQKELRDLIHKLSNI